MLLLLLICCSTTEKTSEEYNEHQKWAKCSSKRSGSQPECWDEKDWEIYCSKVKCIEKETTQLGGE